MVPNRRRGKKSMRLILTGRQATLPAVWRAALLGLVLGPLTAVTAGVAGGSPADPLPELDPARLRGALAGLPDQDVTGAILRVSGRAGHWSGEAGVARLGSPRRPHPGGRFRIGSVTKLFTATIALQLAADGELDLHQSVQHYLPGLLPSRYPRILVSQLLNHTSGLPDSTEDAANVDPRSYVAHRFEYHSPPEVVETSRKAPMLHAPGTAQRYNGVNYFLVDMVIEEVTGHSYAHELRSRITRPLALRDTYLPAHNDPRLRGRHARGYLRIGTRYVDVTEQSPYAWAEGGMVSSTRDLDRFLRALFRGRLLPDPQQQALFSIPTCRTSTRELFTRPDSRARLLQHRPDPHSPAERRICRGKSGSPAATLTLLSPPEIFGGCWSTASIRPATKTVRRASTCSASSVRFLSPPFKRDHSEARARPEPKPVDDNRASSTDPCASEGMTPNHRPTIPLTASDQDDSLQRSCGRGDQVERHRLPRTARLPDYAARPRHQGRLSSAMGSTDGDVCRESLVTSRCGL